jgi:mycothiol maleylpyruvate isomerase-like protein/MDMPI-like protein
MVDKDDFLASLQDDSAALAAAARLGLAADVPPCPGWSVADLVVHLGAVQRAQAEIVRSRAQEPQGIKREMFEGIDHSFDVMLPARRGSGNAPNGQGESFRFEQMDGDRIWSIRFQPEGVQIRRDDGPADVTARGTASDLFLLLWRRIPAERLVVAGDPAGFDRYFELVPLT